MERWWASFDLAGGTNMDGERNGGKPGFDIWKADRIEAMYRYQPELVALQDNVVRLAEPLQMALASWCCERCRY
jgi:hypothetical protein